MQPRVYMLVLCLCTLAAGPTLAAEKLILQLKWVPQSQFAGYYAAQDRGFYAGEGLDVEIRAGGPKIDPANIAAAGQADVIVDWMPAALEAREHSVPLVNIAQPFKRSASALACRRDNGIIVPEDLRGETIAVWPNDDASFLLSQNHFRHCQVLLMDGMEIFPYRWFHSGARFSKLARMASTWLSWIH